MIPTLFGMSLISFVDHPVAAGRLPHFVVATMTDSGQTVDPAQLELLKTMLRLRPAVLCAILQVDLGHRPARRFRLFVRVEPAGARPDLGPDGLTLVISILSLLFIWIVSLPIGIYSAVRRNLDRRLRLHALRLSRPRRSQLPARAVADVRRLPLFRAERRRAASPDFAEQPGLAKFGDLLAHLWIPVIVIGTSGTAALIRILRANLLDELHKPYVITRAREGPARVPGDPELSACASR